MTFAICPNSRPAGSGAGVRDIYPSVPLCRRGVRCEGYGHDEYGPSSPERRPCALRVPVVGPRRNVMEYKADLDRHVADRVSGRLAHPDALICCAGPVAGS